MSAEAHAQDLVQVVTLLGAAVLAVPLFRRLGLGSVLGYLVAGLLIGPFGFGWFTDSQSILHVAELGVVMFLFVIGLEMRPSHLWSLRRDIFGLGSLQILVCTALLTGILHFVFQLSWVAAFIGGMGFVLTSTAIVMQLLGERGDLALPRGQKMVSILLFEDLLIVPLLAIVALLAPRTAEHTAGSGWMAFGIGTAAVALIVAAGLWLLNPLFRLLANAKAREVMTAAALLVVLGAALLMQMSGLSMAMGAFLAGVLLAESSFRNQIEADIEPFRGILLGLFFIGVGMSLNLSVVQENLYFILTGVLAMMLAKSLCIYVVARFTGTSHSDSLDRMVLMAQGGEFAFVLYAAAAQANVIDTQINANMTAIVVLSMALTPLVAFLFKRFSPAATQSLDGVEEAHDLAGSMLLIGFGRFGQVTSQLLLARDIDVTIIDNDPEMIRSASEFGFKIYYGDGTRLDVLRASGAAKACTIAVCVDDKEAATRIVKLVKSEFPQAKVLARAYDRVHALELVNADVDFQIRETFESALQFGQATLHEMGLSEEEVATITDEIRQRDRSRFELEVANNDVRAGRPLMLGNMPKPTPLLEPQRESRPLTPDTAAAAKS